MHHKSSNLEGASAKERNGVFYKPPSGSRKISSFFHRAIEPRSPPPRLDAQSLPPTPLLTSRSVDASRQKPVTLRIPESALQERCEILNRPLDTELYRFRSRDPVFIYFDTETTGLQSNSDQVIELAAIVDSHQIESLPDECRQLQSVFQTLIKPQCEITDGAYQVHRISEQMLESAPSFADAYGNFLNWVQQWRDRSQRDVLLVAYGASFDVSMLLNNNQRCSGVNAKLMPLERVRFACMLTAVRDLHGIQVNLKLHQVLKKFCARERIVFQEHRALPDSRMAMRLAHHMPDNELIYRELVRGSF
jgi:DNA polymerase III epsilon subunit-like protein